jgi:SAM-dependent methyltransferase
VTSVVRGGSLPPALKSLLRKLYYHHAWARRLLYSPLDAWDRLQGADPLVPPRHLRISGYGDYRAIGRERFREFVELGGLGPTDDVLEVGCGTGRLALGFVDYLTSGSYVGFDIIPESIAWAQRNFTRRYPRFRFELADVENRFYHPGGKASADAYRFPYGDSCFDFVIASSVFTHMLEAEVTNYVREAARVLRPGGHFFASFFLVDEAAKPIGPFHSEAHGALVVDPRIPEAAVAHPVARVKSIFAANSLEVDDERIYRGTWTGRPGGRSYQDLLIARKPA